MENNNQHPENEKLPVRGGLDPEEQDTEFENPSIDPGFGAEDTADEDEDSADHQEEGNDALNYKNDRENGAYNPKNI